ncbi:MAG: NINE protein [Saprospiraceae bacterium]|nr:NINE protein [Saprospiraceae bacterium]
MSRRRSNQSERSRIFAALLAIFFGGFGAHKFYLRDPGAGILYIFIFFIASRIAFPISFILGWIDAFRLLTMGDEAFDRKYNKHLSRDPRSYVEPNRPRRRRPGVKERRRSRPSPRAIQKANPFKKSGLRKYKEFDLEGAIEDFEQGLEINPSDIALHFNLACAYSLTEQKDKSFKHLSQAVDLGYNDFKKIQEHDDLAFLRIQPEFDDFKDNGYRLGRKNISAPAQGEETEESPQQEVKDDVLLSQLNKLAELRKKGLLTEEEFNMERKKLLRR